MFLAVKADGRGVFDIFIKYKIEMLQGWMALIKSYLYLYWGFLIDLYLIHVGKQVKFQIYEK